MIRSKKKLKFTIERTIQATPSEAFDGWLDAKVPGTTWHAAEKFILNAKVDGLFYWLLKGTPHFGRFTEVKRPLRLEHTWMSPSTLGQESLVTVTFVKHGEGTLMKLVHSRLPDCEPAEGHENGWNYFMEIFCEQFGDGSRKSYRWEDAHPRRQVSKSEKPRGKTRKT